MTQIFLTSGTSWTVPSDWNSGSNTIECIGGGQAGSTSGTGGTGGAYSKVSNFSAAVGNNLTIQIGAGGVSSGANGGDTWFNLTSTVLAPGGGSATTQVGTTQNTGGGGGASNGAGGGGGGAAGPNGNGGAGGSSGFYGGGGGGGNGGGANGSTANGLGGPGGEGGNNLSGSAGGAGGNNASGSPGTNGGGGGGAGYSAGTTGGAGGNGTDWTASYGSGGGGGGANLNGASALVNGGTGGLYGAGGSGGNPVGAGAQGIIVITYTPTSGATVAAEAGAAGEFQSATHRDQPVSIAPGLTVSRDTSSPFELCASAQGSGTSRIGYLGLVGGGLWLPAECASAFSLTADVLARLEVGAFLHGDAIGRPEFAGRTVRSVSSRAEWGSALFSETEPGRAVPFWLEILCALVFDAGSSNEILASLCREGFLAQESLSSGVRLSIEGPGILEWADPPALPLVSPGRLLRSPGRIRILAGPGSIHPLRAQ
jgi:hypothetical protein